MLSAPHVVTFTVWPGGGARAPFGDLGGLPRQGRWQCQAPPHGAAVSAEEPATSGLGTPTGGAAPELPPSNSCCRSF